ncbi:hypothetical protein Cni_G13809 [Canna indica]|uniref:Uncharacterized protein n=1 Tax=Canna indica TaxID=4628 RepID=A0AAQ3QD15_9LILI|nr:hypothetical protein Cni_G13809 [Canna indica]
MIHSIRRQAQEIFIVLLGTLTDNGHTLLEGQNAIQPTPPSSQAPLSPALDTQRELKAHSHSLFPAAGDQSASAVGAVPRRRATYDPVGHQIGASHRSATHLFALVATSLHG